MNQQLSIVGIEQRELEIHVNRECCPGQVRIQEPGGDDVYALEGAYCCRDRGPETDLLDECQARFAHSKEGDRPSDVEHQLGQETGFGHTSRATVSGPDHPCRDAHQRIEAGPDRVERSDRGHDWRFVQVVVPAGVRLASKDVRDVPGAET